LFRAVRISFGADALEVYAYFVKNFLKLRFGVDFFDGGFGGRVGGEGGIAVEEVLGLQHIMSYSFNITTLERGRTWDSKERACCRSCAQVFVVVMIAGCA
jgi:hypothetical protein